MSKKLQRKQIDINLSEGRTGSTGSDDYGTINVSRLDDTDKMEDAFHKIEIIIDKLAPETPPRLDDPVFNLDPVNFSTTPIGFIGSARIAGTGATVNNIFREDTGYEFEINGRPSGEPVANDGFAFDADSGDLLAQLDAASDATITFTLADDSQTVTSGDAVLALTVGSEKDYFTGIAGKEGFWNAFESSITLDPSAASGALDPGQTLHTLELTHSTTGSQSIDFYVEDPSFPSLSALSGQVNMNQIVSGVPTVDISDNIFGDFTVTNAVKNFYRNDLMILTGPSLTTDTFSAGVRSVNEVITDQLQVNALPNSFRNTNIELNFTGRDAFGNSTSSTVNLTNKRIDTASVAVKNRDISTSSGRYLANSNEAVTSGGNGIPLTIYDHQNSLLQTAGNYNLQLQVYNGNYRYPVSNNYSTYEFFNGGAPIAGPNYSSGIVEPKRWAAFSYDLTTNKALTQEVIIDILNNNGITTSNQISNQANLYYKVITWAGPHGGAVLQETVWIEAIGNVNAATFNGGLPFMVGQNGQTETSVRTDSINGAHIGVINENNRVLTVGQNINGNGTNVSVHVRIGISIGQSFSFNGLNVSLN